MSAVLSRRWSGDYELTVTNTRNNLQFTYPVTFASAAAGLAFALEAGIGTVRVVG